MTRAAPDGVDDSTASGSISRLRRVACSALALSVVGAAVAVLGAPVKWM